MVTEGFMADVKNAIITHIAAADSSLTPASTHVLGSWELDIWELDTDNLPIVTVRIGPSTTHEVAFGRRLSASPIKKGTYVTFFFTAHIFHSLPSSGDKSKNAMDIAEKIKSKLLKSEDTSSGIVHYERITLREAPINVHNVARVILEGFVFVRRPH